MHERLPDAGTASSGWEEAQPKAPKALVRRENQVEKWNENQVWRVLTISEQKEEGGGKAKYGESSEDSQEVPILSLGKHQTPVYWDTTICQALPGHWVYLSKQDIASFLKEPAAYLRSRNKFFIHFCARSSQ